MSSADVTVIILHPEPPATAGPLERAMAVARARLAEGHRAGFIAAGATTATIVAGPSDERTFGARLEDVVAALGPGGLVVLGSGAVPLATAADRRAFVAAAAADRPGALTNNRFSADVVALARARTTIAIGRAGAAHPPLAAVETDNALPRWLEEIAGVPVTDLRHRWRLGVDIDGPLDLVLLGGRCRATLTQAGVVIDRVLDRLARIARVTADPRAEVVIAGRTSPRAVLWLERSGHARTRAIIEERGMRTALPDQRPPSSLLGALLERDGPGSLGDHLGRLGEAAIVDSRVLMAHRLGADERTWPVPEDRFAADLLLHESITDAWLRDLARSAAEAPIPIVLGGHTLVGPGLRLALRAGRYARSH